MNLKDWMKEDRETSEEYVQKTLEKTARGQRIDWFEDILCEFKDLKEESYAVFYAAGSPDLCEHFPGSNLGLLLGSGLYSKVIVPLRASPDKSTFEFRYGLSESKGSHLSFEHFLSLVKDGKLRIILTASPDHYKAKFYQEIFKSCDELPPFIYHRNTELLYRLKLISKAISKEINPSGNWTKIVLKLYPEYDFFRCYEEIKHAFGEYLNRYAQKEDLPNEGEAAASLASKLWDLRILGFERFAELALKCIRLDKKFGDKMLDYLTRYLGAPIVSDLFANQNYGYLDIRNMSFLHMLPKKLEIIWKDILSSSPICSSVASPQIGLDTIRLRGTELLELIENFAEDKNAKSLRQNIVNVNKSLGKLDIHTAERSLDKVDEIITESINSEIKGYEKKGRIANHLLRLGKTFTSITTEGSAVISGFMAASGNFELAATALSGVGVAAWVREKLGEIKPEDIVRWRIRSWPFDDHGVGFFIWEETHQKSS